MCWGLHRFRSSVSCEKKVFLLSCAAIPIGVVLGSVLGYCFVPDGWHWMTTLECAVVIALVTEIALKIAVHTPVKKASMVSPIEALRINTTDTPATEKTRIETSKNYAILRCPNELCPEQEKSYTNRIVFGICRSFTDVCRHLP